MRKNKRCKEIEIANEGKTNPRKFFSYYSAKDKTCKKIGPLLKNMVHHSDDQSVINILNDQFKSVFNYNPQILFDPDLDGYEIDSNLNLNKISNLQMTEAELLEIIHSFDIHKSSGPDDINIKTLVNCIDVLKEPLLLIINESLNTGHVPKDWKIANVTPIFKSGNKNSAENYRPISITSIVSRIIEKKIKNDLTKFLEGNLLIRDSQHGFRSGRSCLTNLLEFAEFICNELDSGNAVDVIFLDFAKAFDKVPHGGIILKLKSLGWMEHLEMD